MPLPSTIQTHMDVFHGLAPNVDGNHIIDDIAFKFNVVAKVAAYTCKVKESGTWFTTEGATAAVTFTLPAVADSDNVVYWFYSAEDFAMTIAAPAGTMVAGNGATSTSIAFDQSTQIIGTGAMVVCDGSLWYAFPIRGQGDNVVTVA
ncbi:MAG: hypothetical protein KAH01_00285 [Caldisericia bacterium]|nr:hypothetical protein [Caldisericia bacterium]